MSRDVSARDAGAGGGGVGATPQTWKFWELAPPQLWTVDVVHLCFGLFLHLKLRLPKKYWNKSGEILFLGRGYLGPREIFAPPPPLPTSK